MGPAGWPAKSTSVPGERAMFRKAWHAFPIPVAHPSDRGSPAIVHASVKEDITRLTRAKGRLPATHRGQLDSRSSPQSWTNNRPTVDTPIVAATHRLLPSRTDVPGLCALSGPRLDNLVDCFVPYTGHRTPSRVCSCSM